MLLLLTDFDYSTISSYIQSITTTKPLFALKLKYNNIIYNNQPLEIIKKIELNDISYTDDIGGFMTVTISITDRF